MDHNVTPYLMSDFYIPYSSTKLKKLYSQLDFEIAFLCECFNSDINMFLNQFHEKNLNVCSFLTTIEILPRILNFKGLFQ